MRKITTDRLPLMLKISIDDCHTKKEFQQRWEAGEEFQCSSFGWRDLWISKELAPQLYSQGLKEVIVPLIGARDAVYYLKPDDYSLDLSRREKKTGYKQPPPPTKASKEKSRRNRQPRSKW